MMKGYLVREKTAGRYQCEVLISRADPLRAVPPAVLINPSQDFNPHQPAQVRPTVVGQMSAVILNLNPLTPSIS